MTISTSCDPSNKPALFPPLRLSCGKKKVLSHRDGGRPPARTQHTSRRQPARCTRPRLYKINSRKLF